MKLKKLIKRFLDGEVVIYNDNHEKTSKFLRKVGFDYGSEAVSYQPRYIMFVQNNRLSFRALTEGRKVINSSEIKFNKEFKSMFFCCIKRTGGREVGVIEYFHEEKNINDFKMFLEKTISEYEDGAIITNMFFK